MPGRLKESLSSGKTRVREVY